jgi:hypothetical protein
MANGTTQFTHKYDSYFCALSKRCAEYPSNDNDVLSATLTLILSKQIPLLNLRYSKYTKNRPQSCDTRAVGFFWETLLGIFEGGLGCCEACHGDAER